MKLKLFALTFALLLTVSPALAQGGGMHTVTFDGVRFSFDVGLAANVNIAQIASDPVDYQAPGGPQVGHVQFTLSDVLAYGSPVPSMMEAPATVLVFRIADFVGYDYYQQMLQALQTVLAQRPDLGQYMVPIDSASNHALPFLPILPAAQVIRARAQYIDSGTLSGISYVTTFQQGISPYTSGDMLYTFQGLSVDGQYYVVVVSHLTTGLFPDQIPQDFNYDSFVAGLAQYNADSIARLNTAAPGDFSPSLDTLNALVWTIAFGQ